MLVEPNAEGIHQKCAQKAIAQMPQIACLDPFEFAPIGQLPKNRVNMIANLPWHRTRISRSERRERFAERCLQDDPFRAHAGLHVGQPIVAITKDQIVCSLQEHRSNVSVRLICWSQKHMGDDARPAQTQMQAKAVKGLAVGMIFAITGLSAKAHTPGSTGKAANRKQHAVDDANQLIVSDQFIAQIYPQALFDRPQIGGLPDKGRAVHLAKTLEEMGILPSEEGKERFILAASQRGADHFHGQHFAIPELGHGLPLPKPLLPCHIQHHVVNPTKTGDNTVVQVYEGSPQKRFVQCSEDIS